MQSWGSDSQFTLRTTHQSPTKSGVIGLCCAALGWTRNENVSPFLELRMGCRILNPGMMMSDFQTVKGVMLAQGKGRKDVISTRYYLSDAEFLVGLEGSDLDFLKELHHALRHSKFCISLGRKSYVPSKPVFIPKGLRKDEDLEHALINYFASKISKAETIELILEAPISSADEIWLDQPMEDSFITRKFEQRGIITKVIQIEEVD
jgi:CRISPR system Cascade subunit CasD